MEGWGKKKGRRGSGRFLGGFRRGQAGGRRWGSSRFPGGLRGCSDGWEKKGKEGGKEEEKEGLGKMVPQGPKLAFILFFMLLSQDNL